MQGGGSGPDTAMFLLRITRPIGADRSTDQHDQPPVSGGGQKSTQSGHLRAWGSVRLYAWLLAGPGNDKPLQNKELRQNFLARSSIV